MAGYSKNDRIKTSEEINPAKTRKVTSLNTIKWLTNIKLRVCLLKLELPKCQNKMEFNDDVKDSDMLKEKGTRDESSNLLASKLAELEEMKENLKQAKDEAMQSWLDSRPLIDELEKMQAELANAKARAESANTTISELQAQLGDIETSIKSKKEEELKYRVLINDRNQDLHRAQEGMEQLKMKIDRKRRRRAKLKQVLRLKRQTLETLLLTLEAIRLESEAFRTSAARGLYYLDNVVDAKILVQLTQEEYDFLKREAREQTSRAELRISVSAEEKTAAENNRDAAFNRLQKLYSRNGSSRQNKMERTIGHENNTRLAGVSSSNRVGRQNNYRHSHVPKAQLKARKGINRSNQQQQLKNKYNTTKKRSSICFRVKTTLTTISRCFRRSSV